MRVFVLVMPVVSVMVIFVVIVRVVPSVHHAVRIFVVMIVLRVL
ncbi:MAG: hypothetical protein AAFV43_16985 [Planctomycetota bacterium]